VANIKNAFEFFVERTFIPELGFFMAEWVTGWRFQVSFSHKVFAVF
jgi:hypothetical protein